MVRRRRTSVRALLSNMMSMMGFLNTRMYKIEGGRKKRKVAFQGDPPACRMPAPVPEMTGPPGLLAPTMSLLPRLPHSSQDRLASTASGSLLPPLPVDTQEGPEMNPPGVSLPHLPDMSGAVRARVTQQLWRATSPFLLTDEDSPSDEQASPVKRKRHSIKSGRLWTM